MIYTYRNFWVAHPALFYSLSFLLGFYSYFYPSPFLTIPFIMLLGSFLFVRSTKYLRHLLLSVLTALTAYGYSMAHFHFPELPPNGIKGVAYIHVEKISLQQSMFGPKWVYQCKVKQFHPKEGMQESIAKNLPCKITFSADKNKIEDLPSSTHSYWIEGRLIQKDNGGYHLKILSKTCWHVVNDRYTFTKARYKWKQVIDTWIHRQFSDNATADFIAGLATGEFNNSFMRQQFSRFGLQHLLAISGFHFAITACFLNLILSLMLPTRIKNFALLFLLSGYSVFLGPFPSVLRAWIMCSLSIVGQLVDKKTTPLNSLGVALFGILAFDPLLSLEVSFKLSVCITASILLFYPLVSIFFNQIIPKHRLSEVLTMNQLNQCGYCLVTFLREGFALTVAVNLLAIPFTLYYFDRFPWMSLFFNLFFPFLTAISIMLFLLSASFFFLPWVPSVLMKINEIYSSMLLKLIYYTPEKSDRFLTVHPFSEEGMMIYLCLILTLGIWVREKKMRSDGREVFQFI